MVRNDEIKFVMNGSELTNAGVLVVAGALYKNINTGDILMCLHTCLDCWASDAVNVDNGDREIIRKDSDLEFIGFATDELMNRFDLNIFTEEV